MELSFRGRLSGGKQRMWICRRGVQPIQPRYQRDIRMSAVKGIHKWRPETGLEGVTFISTMKIKLVLSYWVEK